MTAKRLKSNLIGELEYLFSQYYWIRHAVLLDEMGDLPFFLLRQAVVGKRVSLSGSRRVTLKKKSDLTKARAFLRHFIEKVRVSRRGRHMRYIKATERGRNKLEQLDKEIEKQLLSRLGFTDREQLHKFTRALKKANDLLPGSDNTKSRHYEEHLPPVRIEQSGGKSSYAEDDRTQLGVDDYEYEEDDDDE